MKGNEAQKAKMKGNSQKDTPQDEQDTPEDVGDTPPKLDHLQDFAGGVWGNCLLKALRRRRRVQYMHLMRTCYRGSA